MLEFLPKRGQNSRNWQYQSHLTSELNDPLTTLICSISVSTRADSGNIDDLSLWNHLPPSLQTKSPTDIDEIHRVTPIKILRDLSKSLLRIHQYGITKEAFQRKKIHNRGVQSSRPHYFLYQPLYYFHFSSEKTKWLMVEVCPWQ